MNGKKKGFTLIELLVVVLIIGILAAIALPQYQKAVLKSRYTTLMPIAKGIAEGNEAYFMEHGTYADDPTELPIKGQESYPDGTELRVVDDTDKDVSYVIATRPKLMPNNKYIVFQKHSGKFSDVTLCEATSDPLATWLCKDALKGKVLPGKTLSGAEWTGYVLSGNDTGSKFAGSLEDVVSDLQAQNSNYEVVSMDEENGQVILCDTSVATVNSDGKCVATSKGGNCHYDTMTCDTPYEITYDEDGEILAQNFCSSSSGEVCRTAYLVNYDQDGGYSSKMVSCREGIGPLGTCNNLTQVIDYGFDSKGNKTYERWCNYPSGTSCPYTEGMEIENSYDANGQLSYIAKQCSSYNGTSGSDCINYWARVPVYEDGVYKGYRQIWDFVGDFEAYRFDENGNQIGDRVYCGQNVDWANAQCAQ